MDPFLQNAWNALPQIILTSLITGVGVYFIQKKIDARNQRLAVRDPTIFVRNHQKRLDALEEIHKVLISFSEDLSKHLHKNKKVSNKVFFSRYESVKIIFSNNLIYFTEYEKLELFTISSALYLYVLWAMKEISFKPHEGAIEMINEGIEDIETGFTQLDVENPNLELFYSELKYAVHGLIKRVRKLYSATSKLESQK